eukprot:NODE_293_length_10559_cov_1.046463.p8 type:complete len:135 gc:universal NODE_293_length_10559_cov_1.046463:4887-4483(-)
MDISLDVLWNRNSRPSKVFFKMFSIPNSVFVIYFAMVTRVLGISSDCPLIINFLKGLNMHQTDPVLFQRIPVDCCNFYNTDAYGYLTIGCKGSGSSQIINELVLAIVKINGTIQAEYLPSNLTSLSISGCNHSK